MEANASRSPVCFGPYEVDLRTQEIRREGTLVRLSGQPFQILEVLLSRPGELISRDELQQRLWPGASVVDCTHGLNAAINKLREALGDSAISPRYVETLPRRGYRFVGEIRKPASDSPQVEVLPLLPEPQTIALQQSSPPLQGISRHWPVALMSLVALVVGGMGGIALKSGFRGTGVESLRRAPEYLAESLEALEKRKDERRAATPKPSPEQRPRAAGPVTRPAVLRERSHDSVHRDPTLRTVVSGSGSAGPQFSPDGKHIAFMSNRGGSWQVWVSAIDGCDPVQISSTESAGTPRWSPDGKRIVFDAPCDNGTCVFVARIDRQESSQRLDEGFVPSFSRDGKWIYFASERSDNWQVWRVPSKGGIATRVTEQGGFAAFESPDGFVYYAKSRGSYPEIWQVPVSGGKESMVSRRIQPRTWASWTVTNKGILFVADSPSKGSQLSLYEPATGQVRELLALPSAPFWMGATPDGHRVAVNDASERQITLVENLR